MGSGKTSLGKKLARKLDLSFVDLDSEIMKQETRSISEIFRDEGETGFRSIEKEILVNWFGRDNYLMACGGGAPCYSDNIEQMNAVGITLFLDVPEPVLFERLVHKKETRPLLSGKNDEGLKVYIHSELIKRESCYQKAKIKANPLDASLDLLVRLFIP